MISFSQGCYSLCMTFITLGLFIYWSKKYKSRYSIRNKVVLITGACAKDGLGINIAAVAKTLGAKTVIVTSRREESGVDGVEFLQCVEGESEIYHVLLDLNWPSEKIIEVVQNVWKTFKRIDVVIANAGISYRGDILKTSDKVFNNVMQSNFTGNVTLLNEFGRLMMAESLEVEDEGFYIVGVSSVQGRISIPYRSAYSASKHAISAYLDCLRSELADKVRVLTVNPSYICTNLSKNAIRDSGSTHGRLDETTAKGMKPEIVASSIMSSIRFGESELNLLDFKSRAAILIRTLAPNLFFEIMRKRAKKSVAY